MVTGAQAEKPGWKPAAAIWDRWLGELPIYLIGLSGMAACITLLTVRGVSPGLSGLAESFRVFALFVMLLGAIDAGQYLLRQRPDRPLLALRRRYSAPLLRQRALAGLPMIAAAIIILPFFSMMKAAIPLFNDFLWDQTFIEWDRMLFAGRDAWQVLHPLLGYPIVTAALALIYHLWFLLLYPGVMFFAFSDVDDRLRRQFFLSYMLSWLLVGGIMATWLASVGPCFLGPLLGNSQFDPQMAYLAAANEQIPVMTLRVQELLLQWHEAGADGLGSGITAMPSMHCAIAFVYWLAARRINRRLGLAFGAFFCVIWIGSVHLAYHYAVDGLVSVAAVAAIWAVCGRIIAAWDGWLARYPALRRNTVPAE